MRLLPTLLIALLLAFGLALGLTVMWRSDAGGGAAASGMPAVRGGVPQGHVYTGVAEEPDDVNPYTAAGSVARGLVLAYTHDTLLDRDPESGALRPALASSYELAPDGGSCTFTLRDGVTFSDGAPLTMADVLFGYELHRAGHLATGFAAAAFDKVARCEVLDERRLRVHFDSRHFAVLAAVGESWIVGRRAFFEGEVRRRLLPEEPMPAIDSARFAELLDQVDERCGPGTGPYALHNDPAGLRRWRRRQDILLERHEACWRREVRPGSWNFAGVRVLFKDPGGATNALLRRELDWFSSPKLVELLASRPELGEHYRRLVYDYPRLGVVRIVWNCRRPPFDDARVRRALGMLIDREQLVQVFGGAAQPALAHAKLGSAAYPELAPLPHDLTEARRLLREAGFEPGGNPLKLTLLAVSGSEEFRRIAELFADAARTVGIELDLRERLMAAFVAEKKRGDWDGLLALQYFEPWCDPYRFLHTDGLDNDGGWSDPEADRLAAAARVEFDPARRAALWRELHTLAHEQQPVALLVHPLVSLLLNRHLMDCEPGPLGLKPWRAWVPPEHQRR